MKDLFHFLKLVCLQIASVLYYISLFSLHYSATAPEAPVVATFRPGLGADTHIVTLQEEVEDCNLRTAPAQPGQASWSPPGGDDGDRSLELLTNLRELLQTYVPISFLHTYRV